jgi:hypothetical protein
MSSSTVALPPTRLGAGTAWIGVAIGLVLVLAAVLLQVRGFTTPSSVGAVPAGGSGGFGRTSAGDVPDRLLIGAIAVDAPVRPVAISAGQLGVPADGRVLGWWRDGAAPAAGAGTVVLAGHVDTKADGPGALYRLETLVPGQGISVSSASGPAGYRVVARHAYRKGRLPADLFSADGPARLALVTCGGAFDRTTRTYAYNVVVYAVPEV